MTKKRMTLFGVLLLGFLSYSFLTAKMHPCHFKSANTETQMIYFQDGFALKMSGKSAQQRAAIKDVLLEKAKNYQEQYPESIVAVEEKGNAVSLIVKGLNNVSGNYPLCPFKNKNRKGSPDNKNTDSKDSHSITL